MTSSLEGWPTKAKEAPSPQEVRLAPLDTNPVFKMLPDMQFCFCLYLSSFCHVLLIALDIDCYCFNSSRLSSQDWHISWVIERNWLMHESPGLKPDWLSDIKLFFVKNLNVLSYSNLSRISPVVESNDCLFFNIYYHPFYELETHPLFSIHQETFSFLNRTERLVLKVCK